MGKSSLRHNREIYGVDAAGETPEDHGEVGNDGGGSLPPGVQWYRDFSSGSLGEGATFSRLSSATYFDGAALQVAVVDEVRFQPNNGGVLLCEPATTNYCVRSEEFELWTVQRGTVTLDGGSILGIPAYRFTPNTDSHTHRMYIQSGSGAGAGEEVTTWMLEKLADYPFFYATGDLLSNNLGTNSYFDVESGVPLVAGNNVNYTEMQDIGIDGWFRSVIQSTASGASRAPGLGVSPDGVGSIFAGNDSDYALAAGCQSEIGTKPSSYIPTAGAAETRAADVLSYADVPTPNETRFKTPDGDVDGDDWDGVVPTVGQINAIEVYPVGQRP